MTPNMNNSVCPHLAGFCLKTGFALGLDIDQGRTRREAAQLMFGFQKTGLLTVGSVSAQAPPNMGHSLNTLFWLLTHIVNRWP